MFEKDSSYMVGSGSVFNLGFMSKSQHMGPKLCFRGSELFGEICESVNYSMTALRGSVLFGEIYLELSLLIFMMFVKCLNKQCVLNLIQSIAIHRI